MNLADEKRRYDFHQNDPADGRYLDFLGRLAGPLSDRLPRGAEGLDFGCGPGPAMSRWFAAKGFRVADYDPLYRAEAPLLERSYDFITCSEVIEHFYDPRREFVLLDRLLKPGAFLGVMTQNVTEEGSFKTWWYPGDSTHVCFYQRQTFEWIASWRGWDLVLSSEDVVIFQKQDLSKTGCRGE